jgi:predicted aspartyl protease
MIPIRLYGVGGAVVEDSALIDTGADSSAFPLSMMSRLGIQEADCDPGTFESAGGEAKKWTYRRSLNAQIAGQEIELKAVFCNTPVSLLGREDFLGRFRVGFDQRKSRYRIQPY